MSAPLDVPVDVRWFTPEEGGRRSGPPPGPLYKVTGRFTDQKLEEMSSVVLTLTATHAGSDPYHVVGVLSPLFPENVPDFAERMARGDRFILHEGRRAVAECVLNVASPASTDAPSR